MNLKTESKLEKVLAAGHFAVTAEIGPPRSAASSGITKNATLLKDYTDGQNLTDNQTAIVRLSSIAAGVHVLRAGGNPIIQATCRDRNRIALQSDLLGAYSLGINTVLLLSGDHQSFGNHQGAKNVYDLDSINLVQMVRKMRDESKFLNGEEMKTPPKFFIGAACNPFGDPFDFRVFRLAKKVAAGADFIQTQGIFDLKKFEKFMQQVRDMGLDEKVYIMGGVIPVKSAKAMARMKEVPGLSVPDELVKRMEGAANQEEEGIKITVEMIQQLKEIKGVRGVHIMAIAWESIVPTIVEQAGLYPRPKLD